MAEFGRRAVLREGVLVRGVLVVVEGRERGEEEEEEEKKKKNVLLVAVVLAISIQDKTFFFFFFPPLPPFRSSIAAEYHERERSLPSLYDSVLQKEVTC